MTASMRSAVPEMRKSTMALRQVVRQAALFGIVAGGLGLIPVLYMLEVYQRVVPSRSLHTLAMLVLLALFLTMIAQWLLTAQARLLRAGALCWDELMSRRVFDAMYAKRIAQGSLGSEHPLADWRKIREMVHGPVLKALVQAPVSLLFGTILFLLHPLLGWVAVAMVVLQLTLTFLRIKTTQQGQEQEQAAAQRARTYAQRAQQQAETAEAMGMMPHLLERWRKYRHEAVQMRALTAFWAGNYRMGTRFFQQAFTSGLLGLAAWIALEGNLAGGAGMMIVASILGSRMMSPLTHLMAQWTNIREARAAWSRLETLLEAYPERKPAMALPAPTGRLSVEAAVAAAPQRQGDPPALPILKGLNFSLEAGEAMAVIGPSGSGKTSLTRLLVGLWPCLEGKVRLDGADVFTWDKTQLGPFIGYLPQQTGLMEGTLAENVARFGDIDADKLRDALEGAGLWAWAQKLPQGVDTLLGAGGKHLSGGFRQRVGLARALYGRPALLVLDEPNAHLDVAGNTALVAALKRAKAAGTTVVLVTHRLNLLGVCEKVLRIENGEQRAFGSRAEVMKPAVAPQKALAAPTLRASTMGKQSQKGATL